MKDLRISLLLDCYGAVLTDKQREALDFYYNEDLSLFEISEHAGITRQGVRDNIKRGETILLEMEEKLGFCKKNLDVLNAVSEIESILYDLDNLNEKKIFSDDLRAQIDLVRKTIGKMDDDN